MNTEKNINLNQTLITFALNFIRSFDYYIFFKNNPSLITYDMIISLILRSEMPITSKVIKLIKLSEMIDDKEIKLNILAITRYFGNCLYRIYSENDHKLLFQNMVYDDDFISTSNFDGDASEYFTDELKINNIFGTTITSYVIDLDKKDQSGAVYVIGEIEWRKGGNGVPYIYMVYYYPDGINKSPLEYIDICKYMTEDYGIYPFAPFNEGDYIKIRTPEVLGGYKKDFKLKLIRDDEDNRNLCIDNEDLDLLVNIYGGLGFGNYNIYDVVVKDSD